MKNKVLCVCVGVSGCVQEEDGNICVFIRETDVCTYVRVSVHVFMCIVCMKFLVLLLFYGSGICWQWVAVQGKLVHWWGS